MPRKEINYQNTIIYKMRATLMSKTKNDRAITEKYIKMSDTLFNEDKKDVAFYLKDFSK